MTNASRAFVVQRYASLLELAVEHPLCINLEKSTHNWAVTKTISLHDVPACDNHRHMGRYKQKFVQIQKNLRESPDLISRIVTGRVKTSRVMELNPERLWPEGPYAEAKLAGITRDMKKEFKPTDHKDYVGLFKCWKCRGYKTTYYELQTRSADEPMTVFITCHDCDITWKS
jgi:DNA-directed RNA polymerase subunit M/transcription elongation factor TFIIS